MVHQVTGFSHAGTLSQRIVRTASGGVEYRCERRRAALNGYDRAKPGQAPQIIVTDIRLQCLIVPLGGRQSVELAFKIHMIKDIIICMLLKKSDTGFCHVAMRGNALPNVQLKTD